MSASPGLVTIRPPMKSIALVYFNAGGGHRASAAALEAAILEQRRPWQVEKVNLVEVLDPQDSFRKLMGFAPEDVYNKRLARGWTLGLAQELKLLQGMIRFGHPTLVRLLQQHWLKTEPDLVVSLIPNFNRALHESVATTLPGVPYVTVLTDLADHPPSFWIEPDRPQHYICGTPKAVAQARATAHPGSQVHASSGMILRPDFYRPPRIDRAEAMRRLGLNPDRPTGLVMFGGQGSKAMLAIAKQLADVQLIFVCGHNAALADKLRALPASAPRQVLGFTSDIAATMQLADFFIGKPGPGSLSEAVQMGLPVIVVRNAWTMPQERYNTQWVRENGLGLVLPSFRKIDMAVAEMLGRLDEFKAATRRIDNRAVFEVPEILAGILDRSEAALPSPLEA
jgi:UDP-N-acetylglucosamine:LPS N-acetylglucosamine transferase